MKKIYIMPAYYDGERAEGEDSYIGRNNFKNYRTYNRKWYNYKQGSQATGQIPKDFSAFKPSEIVFIYLAYLREKAGMPSLVSALDFALVDKAMQDKKTQQQLQDDFFTTQSQNIDKTANLNEKIPARESSIQSLQTQITQAQDKITELESIKKPSEEEQAELQSTRQNLATLESKLETAQKSLANLKAQLKILASLYDITTGEGLCVDLINYYPTQNLTQAQSENLAYEIPLRRKELESLQNQLQKEKDEDKKTTLQETINNTNEIITQKQAELESNTQELAELKPKIESLLQAYKKAKSDLDFLEKNPLKILAKPEA